MLFWLPKLCKSDGKSWKINPWRVLGGSWELIGSTWGLPAEIFMNFHDFWGPPGEPESTRNVKNRCHNSKFFQESLEKRYRSHFFRKMCEFPSEMTRNEWRFYDFWRIFLHNPNRRNRCRIVRFSLQFQQPFFNFVKNLGCKGCCGFKVRKHRILDDVVPKWCSTFFMNFKFLNKIERERIT